MQDCTEDDVRRFDNLLTYFRRLTEDGVTPLIEKQLLAMLDSAVDFTCFLNNTTHFPQIERLTINRRVTGSNKRIYDISLLKYPPTKKVTSYGRCNMIEQSVLYSAFNMLTVTAELRPLRGDLITTSTWRARGDSTLTYVPIFKNQPNNGTMNPRLYEFNEMYKCKLAEYPANMQRKIELLNHFVADAFTRRFHQTNHLDYIFSAYFSNRILNQDFNNEIEAIFYPSVQQSLAFENLAIKPSAFDNKYELIEVNESIVDMDHTAGQGGTMTIGISDSKAFDYASGTIIWKPTLLSDEEIESFRTRFNYET